MTSKESSSNAHGLLILQAGAKNYSEWRVKTMMRFRALKLHHVLAPAPATLPSTWVNDNDKVIDIIHQVVSWDLHPHFTSETHKDENTHAIEAWNALLKVSRHSYAMIQTDLKKEYKNTAVTADGDLEAFYHRLNAKFTECKAAKVNISDLEACQDFVEKISEKHPAHFASLTVEITKDANDISLGSLFPLFKSLHSTMPKSCEVSGTMARTLPICNYFSREGHTEERCWQRDPENMIRYPPRPRVEQTPAPLEEHAMNAIVPIAATTQQYFF
jgi:hypothetical protein